MNLAMAIAIYFVCWWIILFAVLPFGVTTQQEAGEVVPGTTESAPAVPRLFPKLVVTTIAATVVFSLIYFLMEGGVVTLDNIPFLPRYDGFRGGRP
ncbi:hypothetical protein BMS3Bbin10_01236 [bacterium BMS3Bbin10]|nr:hypothetical protein BMS3Bbin10_01236 [bacterium BMS3Bbin10]